MEPDPAPFGDSGIAADPPAADSATTTPSAPLSTDYPPLESSAEPLIPHCPVPAEVPPEATTPAEEPLDVDPIAESEVAGAFSNERLREAGKPRPSPRRPLYRWSGRGYGDHLGRHARLLMTVSAVLLGVGILGWTCRWRILREVLLQIHATKVPAPAVTEIDPLLCATLQEDPSSKRRIRAADLLLCSSESDATARGEAVWEALLEALRDPDPKVEEAAWQSLGLTATYREPGLDAWLVRLPATRCVPLVANVKSPTVRRELIETLGGLEAKAYREVAQWALRSLDDPKVLNQVFQEIYTLRGNAQGEWHDIGWTARAKCLLAGLENPDTDVRDLCRRRLLDHLTSNMMTIELVDWIRTTRDLPTLEAIFRTIRELGPHEGEVTLKRRLAEETEFGTAVGLADTLERLVGKHREREFLEAGLRNPDPKIRDYFESLLHTLPEDPEAPVEPDDGR